jgi:RimJ/RimL family protein N-acetyltransferase
MSRPDSQPDIPADDLVLRRWSNEDARQIVAAFRDPDIASSYKHPLVTRADAKRWVAEWHSRWQAADGAAWAIVRASDPATVLGLVALRDLYLVAECSYWVISEYRGQGIAPRATRELCEWVFQALDLHRMELRHSVRNARSCRVAAKAGFEPEGIERSLHRYGDGIHDMHRHARVKRGNMRARLRDRALMDVSSHSRLWTGAAVLSAGTGLLAAETRIALVLPLAMIAAVPAVRFTLVHEVRLKPAHRRPAGAARAILIATDRRNMR